MIPPLGIDYAYLVIIDYAYIVSLCPLWDIWLCPAVIVQTVMNKIHHTVYQNTVYQNETKPQNRQIKNTVLTILRIRIHVIVESEAILLRTKDKSPKSSLTYSNNIVT